MSSAAPQVTIILPTYNWSAVLPFSIASALGQSFQDFELIVVGDGCTDDSAEVVASIGDPRVQWVNLAANAGHQSGPNNEGLRRARGALVAYLGHDDLWLPHHLACLVAAVDSGADMAFGFVRMVPAEPKLQRAALAERYLPGMWIAPTATVHRRALTERLGGWRSYRDLAVDPETELWSRFHAAGARIAPVKRLTAVKFPAAARRGVYRERPSHEQAAWLARIRGEPALEAVELARAASEMATAAREQPFRTLVGQVLRRGTRGMARRLGWREARREPGEAVTRRRALKGLEPIPNMPGEPG
ncbi:glycosyltransferase [Bradyrhizobium sp.]|uniref:glycosyltransferase family 2 protein n=1 Tax=Bradyrhizobium sp. TaxID=376 RepID=UPI001EB5217D|nr:glycosyltransferase [Bradyrhizobium sp.]MBV8688446.1 glycosyltransferase [Alphaproteobacteria bacterium]MBV9373066.1 glycosyltransferase [Alphaproteobacteria bacterium]MBV9979112.1 glycosyltransferase [Bradyrhizobium sp.]